jgi:hypothetical protein
MDAPVTEIEFKWYKLKLTYSYWNMWQELAVLMSGTLLNSALFYFAKTVTHLSYKHIYCFPVSACKLIAWYGLATCLDFVFITIIDMAN